MKCEIDLLFKQKICRHWKDSCVCSVMPPYMSKVSFDSIFEDQPLSVIFSVGIIVAYEGETKKSVVLKDSVKTGTKKIAATLVITKTTVKYQKRFYISRKDVYLYCFSNI